MAVAHRTQCRRYAVLVVALVLACTIASFLPIFLGPPPELPRYHTTTTPTPAEPTPTPPAPTVKRGLETVPFRAPGTEIDCRLVLRALRRLYRESQVRQAAWREAGYNLTVVNPRGLNVTELHVLMLGDSWARRHGWSVARHIDACRMLSPEPLIERDECALHFMSDRYGNTVYQVSKSALGLDHTGFLRVHIHYHHHRYLAGAAVRVEEVLRGVWPTPSIRAHRFPHEAQCRDSLDDVIAAIDTNIQMPICLCADTLALRAYRSQRVPVDAIQLFDGMWDTQIQEPEWDLFSFLDSRTDWYLRQARFFPDLSVFPYVTWETMLERFRQFLRDAFAITLRDTVAAAAASACMNVPMPRLLLSRIPRVDCQAPKFSSMQTLNSSTRCEELAWPLHDVVDDVVRAAYGEAVLGLPAVEAPEWLRIINYRPFSATEHPQYRYNYTGALVAPGKYLCTMSDGAHFDTHIYFSNMPEYMLWCARHTHRLFWEEMQ